MEKEEHTVLWIILLGVSMFFSLIYDAKIVHYIQGLRTQLLNFYFIQFSMYLTIPVLIILVTIFFLKQKKFIIPWWMAAITTLFFTLALKFLLGRDSPFVVDESIIALTKETMNSFPSVSTAVAFSALPLISKYFTRFRPFWLVFASLIAFSRVYLGVNYLSDVLAGILAGYLLGKMILVTAERTNKI